MSDFEIRSATPSDAALVLEWIRKLASYQSALHKVVNSEDLLHQHIFCQRPVAEVFLGFHEGQAVAYAMVLPKYSSYLGRPLLYLEDLFIDSATRGQGLGRAFMQFLARLCQERGYAYMKWSVQAWNQPAKQFYLRLGAEASNEEELFVLKGDALHELAK